MAKLEAAMVRRYLNALWEIADGNTVHKQEACEMRVEVKEEVDLREYFGYIEETPRNLFEITLKRMVDLKG